MARRLLVAMFLALAAGWGADPAQEAWELLTQMASALSERNPEAFLDAFDQRMPGYARLREDITALLRNAEVQSAVELESDEGDSRSRVMELDWLLRIRPESDATASTRREQRVKCRLEKTGRKWRVVSFEPLALFAAPGA